MVCITHYWLSMKQRDRGKRWSQSIEVAVKLAYADNFEPKS